MTTEKRKQKTLAPRGFIKEEAAKNSCLAKFHDVMEATLLEHREDLTKKHAERFKTNPKSYVRP